MKNDDPNNRELNLTKNGVEFAPWPTIVENDDLHLGKMSFEIASPIVTFNQRGVSYGLPPTATPQHHELEATFISIEKSAVVRFSFNDVVAFRLLDENGLLEIWGASAVTPRPAQTTFRARGHAWADESVLVFWDGGNRSRYSYFVATMDWCLEVVSYSEPNVAQIGPAIVTKSEGNGS